jgi:hypothetical protein
MKKRFSVMLLISGLFAATACLTGGFPRANQTVKLNFFFTNDTSGYMEPCG